MQLIPIKTRILQPPQDSLFEALSPLNLSFQEGDILVVSSKAVSIHQGRCVTVDSEEAYQQLVEEEADLTIPSLSSNLPNLYVKYHAFVGAAGIDQSNANGHCILLPKDPFTAAHELCRYFQRVSGVTNLAVIIVDSHSVPQRWGSVGISIGFYGLEPTSKHVGRVDVFGRLFKRSMTNVVDGIAAAAVLVMGETNEQTPLCIARDVPNVVFVDRECRDDLLLEYEDDKYYPLFKPHLDKQ